MSGPSSSQSWPVALECDAQPFSLVRARLDGRDLLVWRDDDGAIHVWEDRCPHRSVRLSAGRNLGDSVQSAYHGWRFGKNGTVLSIPAEKNAARSDIAVSAFESVVASGMVWASVGKRVAAAAERGPGKGEVLLRPLPVNVRRSVVLMASAALAGLRLIVAPADDRSSRIFGFGVRRAGETEPAAVRRCNGQLNAFRRRLEAGVPA